MEYFKFIAIVPTVIIVCAYLYALPAAVANYKMVAEKVDPKEIKFFVFMKTWLIMPWFLLGFRKRDDK
jgi:hypothetical protein